MKRLLVSLLFISGVVNLQSQSEKYTHYIDSIYSERVDSETGDYIFRNYSVRDLNEDHKYSQEHYFEWVDEQWVKMITSSISYDSENRVNEMSVIAINDTSSDPLEYGLAVSYLENGLILEKIFSSKKQSQLVTEGTRIKASYLYNKALNITETRLSSWKTDRWVDSTKESRIYNSKGKLSLIIDSSYTLGVWEEESVQSFEYNLNDELEFSNSFVRSGDVIIYSHQTAYVYDQDQLLTQSLDTIQIEDSAFFNFENTYSYNENDQLQTQIYKSYDENQDEFWVRAELGFIYDPSLYEASILLFPSLLLDAEQTLKDFKGVSVQSVVIVELDSSEIEGLTKYFYKEIEVPTGITNIKGTGVIEFYPNPSNGMIFLSNNDSLNEELKIYDLSGNLIEIITISSREIDLSSLKSGVYFLVENSGNEVYRNKLVIE